MRLDETGKNKEVLETGHGLETKKKRFLYKTSYVTASISHYKIVVF